MPATWRRACTVIAIAAAVASCVTACPPRRATSLPVTFGARVTDGQLRISTGSPCTEVTRVTVSFPGSEAELVLEPPTGRFADVEFVSVDGPNDGLETVYPLPADFDWRSAKSIALSVYAADALRPETVAIADLVEESGAHPADAYLFAGQGWLEPGEVEAGDGKEFLATCTPDPKRAWSPSTGIGVRMTDGRLQLSTGKACTGVESVEVDFLPDRSPPDLPSLRLSSGGVPTTFDRITVGEPVPGMVVTEPLPTRFDWRVAERVGLGVYGPGLHGMRNVFLDEVVKGSPKHPADSYWFDDVGWLTPDQAAELAGRRYVWLCQPDRH